MTDLRANAPRQAPAADAAWDLPVRLCHWLIVACVGAAWWTAEARMLEWHRLCGYALLSLLLFRLAWGVVGADNARFARFVKGPRAVLAYVKGRYPHRQPGHNPLGGWSVVALLGLMFCQVALGLFAVDVDGIESGPLAWLVDFDSGRIAAGLHRRVFDVLVFFIGLHLAAVAYHVAVRREPLLRRMGSGGRKKGFGALERRALSIVVFCVVIVYISVSALGR